MTLSEMTADWGIETQLAKIGRQILDIEKLMLKAVRANARDRFRELDAMHAELHEDVAQLLTYWQPEWEQ